ncbi:hypothetical protein ACFVZR_04470 [Streptomyces sp. NPDC058316]|uniref:hypothetical protein n=1 Tax=Streptomyces sp. NPDC058316 TaxID=3346442 RepID=UPI0036EB3F68
MLDDRGFTEGGAVAGGLGRRRGPAAADLLRRTCSHQILPAREELPDSSYLSEIVVTKDRKRADPTSFSHRY